MEQTQNTCKVAIRDWRSYWANFCWKVNEIIFEEANLNPDETKRGEGGHSSTGK